MEKVCVPAATHTPVEKSSRENTEYVLSSKLAWINFTILLKSRVDQSAHGPVRYAKGPGGGVRLKLGNFAPSILQPAFWLFIIICYLLGIGSSK